MFNEPMPVSAAVPLDDEPMPREHCVRSALEIRALLRQFVEGDVPLSLLMPDGTCYTTSLWAEDAQRGVLVFAADPGEAKVQRLSEAHEVIAVGYLDSVKVQFDVQDLVLVHGRTASAFNAEYPREIFRFQRRGSYRVRPVGSTLPHVTLTHPGLPRRQIDLRVIDISHGGLALMLGEDLDLFKSGEVLPNVNVVLDAATQLRASLRVAHVSVVGGVPMRGRRIGCELFRLSTHDQRELQRYIDLTQKRRRLLAL